MTREDELNQKISEVRRRESSIPVQKAEISRLKRHYFTENINTKLTEISERVRKNIEFLKLKMGRALTVNNIIEHMGINVDIGVQEFIRENGLMYSTKMAIIASEFYGIPVEDIMFKDLTIRTHFNFNPLLQT